MKFAQQLVSVTVAILLNISPAFAASNPEVNLFQITQTPYQETHTFVHDNIVVYTTFGGAGGIDIWGYDRKNNTNFPIIEKDDQQWVTHLYKKWLVYEDFDESSQSYDVRLYNLRTKKDILITPGSGNYTSGVTNGDEVVYIDGGACGVLMAYDIDNETTKQIAQSACVPRISDRYVTWYSNGVFAYDLNRDKLITVTNDPGYQAEVNIYDDTVVWRQLIGNEDTIYSKDLRTNKKQTIHSSTDYHMTWPSISSRYIVWGKNTAQHIAGVEGYDRKTGKVFEIQEQGPHQNSNLQTSVWKDTVVWQAWRTGNGDVYGAVLEK